MSDDAKDYSLEGLKTVIANIGTESRQTIEFIDGLLEKGWSQVNERIEGLKELESLKEEILNKLGELNE